MSETIYTIYKRSREEALEETFKRQALRCPWEKDVIFVWQTRMGTNGVRYGSFRTITREELARREYTIEMADYAVSIFWTDELYDHRTHKKVLKNGQESSDGVAKTA